jgi:hypothetical protein
MLGTLSSIAMRRQVCTLLDSLQRAKVAALVNEVAEPAVVLLIWFEFRLRLLHWLGR